jgi:tetratricopeptide (TPR) repeat protein/transcriptional regulator with XRE-family HTH domain
MRVPNRQLKNLLADLGWSQQQTATRVGRVAKEMGYAALENVGRSTISMWISGARPQDPAPEVLREALSRGLGRPVGLEEIGLEAPPMSPPSTVWQVDTLAALADLGRGVDRRGFIGTAIYSVAGLTLPDQTWWQQAAERARVRSAAHGTVTTDDIEAIRDATDLFQRLDQQRGGGYGIRAATVLLNDEVLPALHRRTTSEEQRRDLFAAAGELVYVLGWASFDAHRHGTAQHYLQLATKLAAEAGDRALVGHVLRALAHQAMDLGHYSQAASLTDAATSCYGEAVPRERALLGVVHARSLARTGDSKAASRALLRAEDDLSSASGDEPSRVWFFGRASLAHETARTLQAMGDLDGAEREFERSVRLRGGSFSRTHAVTLGYLGEIQAARGEMDAACATWSRALDAMEGVRSGRARATVQTMRSTLSTVRRRGIPAAATVDRRAAEILRVT